MHFFLNHFSHQISYFSSNRFRTKLPESVWVLGGYSAGTKGRLVGSEAEEG